MDGGPEEPVGWRSSIPGVSQREGAPASLALTGYGVAARGSEPVVEGAQPGWGGSWGFGEGGTTAPAEAGRRRDGTALGAGRPGIGRFRGGRRGGVLVPWRAIALAVVALGAVVGVARAAGVEGGADGAARFEGGDADGAVGWSASPEATVPTESPVASSRAALSPAAATGEAAPDWWTVMADLDRSRVRALSEADPTLLATYAEPGSQAWEADAALLEDLSARGLRPEGLTSRVLAIERVDADGAQAVVQVVDQRTGYSLVDAQGTVVQQVEGAGPARWEVTLVRPPPSAGTDPGWRVQGVAPLRPSEDPDAAADAEASPPAGGTGPSGAP